MKIMLNDTSRLANVNGMTRSQVEMPGCIVWNTIRNIIRLLIYYNQWSDNGVIYQW